MSLLVKEVSKVAIEILITIIAAIITTYLLSVGSSSMAFSSSIWVIDLSFFESRPEP